MARLAMPRSPRCSRTRRARSIDKLHGDVISTALRGRVDTFGGRQRSRLGILQKNATGCGMP